MVVQLIPPFVHSAGFLWFERLLNHGINSGNGADQFLRDGVAISHLQMAEVLYNFADFQQAQDKAREAAVLYERTPAIRAIVLGPSYPETRERLQAVLGMLNRTEEATQEKG